MTNIYQQYLKNDEFFSQNKYLPLDFYMVIVNKMCKGKFYRFLLFILIGLKILCSRLRYMISTNRCTLN